MSPPTTATPRRAAFTLIELLIVVAVIAVLIGVLLPALGGARRQAREVQCLSNMRQFAVVTLAFANDHDGVTPDPRRWARFPDNATGDRPGELFRYFDFSEGYGANNIAECPDNARSNATGSDGDNIFGGDTPLDFDYTMHEAIMGMRTSNSTRYGVLRLNLNPPAALTLQVAENFLTQIDDVPIFVEESVHFYNGGAFTEGMWGNDDQVTTRHRGGGHATFIDGSARHFDLGHGPREDVLEPGKDFRAKYLYARRTGDRWVQIDRNRAFQTWGWIENPRNAP